MELCHQQAGGAEDQDQLTMMEGVENTDNVMKEREVWAFISCRMSCDYAAKLDVLFYLIVNCRIYESKGNTSTMITV